ncbi:hypothetical protein bpSLO_001161 (plasmid) [Borrelia parkeri]|uniref:BTA121 domain-containing protein surface lipoprotein n=1 Tax=Borrelia parkeri TaxID=141 RepID=UPI001FF43365|nr:hypothetical protein [Borrelia parkeri]UPA11308.1 hypothetical protein bpSLO_001161 [Borrelia parkeri]
MVKIKCFGLLLVLILLLLLVISCDSGNRAGAGLGAGGGTELKDENEDEDEDELAYLEEEVTDPRLLALLDNFGVSKAGKKAIGYIRGRFSASDDVYDRLNALGADVTIEKIINPTVSLLKARGEALRVMKGTTNESIKSRLQDMLNRYDTLVESVWYNFFYNKLIGEDVFVEFVTRYVPKFSKFKEIVTNPSVMDVYAWLDADEQATVNEIENIVISGTYDKDRFNNMLNSLGDVKIIEIIKAYRGIKIKQGEVQNSINTVPDDAEKQGLQVRFNTLQGEYDSHIRDAFNKASGELYSQIIDGNNRYHDDFIGIQNNLRAAAAAKAAKEAAIAAEAARAAIAAEEAAITAAAAADAAEKAAAAKAAKAAKEVASAAADFLMAIGTAKYVTMPAVVAKKAKAVEEAEAAKKAAKAAEAARVAAAAEVVRAAAAARAAKAAEEAARAAIAAAEARAARSDKARGAAGSGS